MNIALTGTKITQDTKFLAFEKNNNVDVINVIVDTDESWTYKLDVRYPDKCCTSEPLYNIINLTRNGNLCTAIFTSDMLPFAGKYTMQLRGINGDKVSHSDVFDTWVKYSIEPGSTYNPVPSEFYQIEQNITEINNHPPYPDISGFWMIWNSQTNKYELSDIPAVTASDIGAIPVPTTAEVGQTVVVKTIDETGKPTEWEAMNIPSSGGTLSVTMVDGTRASHTSAEIHEAFQSGKTVQFDMIELVLQLISTHDNMAIFNGTIASDGKVRNFSVTVNNTAEIDVSVYTLYPATADTVILQSSTAGSNKRFEITVDDSGTISATEVVS